jgi:hypothetical protein
VLDLAMTLVIVCTALMPLRAVAFGAESHRLVGEIAERYLCRETRSYLAPLLDGATLANAGTWADAVRQDARWRHTGSWHYINVGDHEPLARAMRREQSNVLSVLARTERELADARLPRERRAEALRFFIHFVADVHQPLHVGRAEDRGGNDIEVRWGETPWNLHEFWDARGLLGGRLDRAERLTAIAALADGAAPAWRGQEPRDWAEESRAWRGFVYSAVGREGRSRLSPGYVAGARNVVELRLAQAGVRLAERLNRLGCPRQAP